MKKRTAILISLLLASVVPAVVFLWYFALPLAGHTEDIQVCLRGDTLIIRGDGVGFETSFSVFASLLTSLIVFVISLTLLVGSWLVQINRRR